MLVRWSLVVAIVVGGCAGGGDPSDDPEDPAETAGDGLLGGFDGKADGTTVAPGKTLAFTLDAGAYPGSGHDDVVVYIPVHFDPTPPLEVVVFLHGWSNCAHNVIGAVDTACTRGSARRRSYALAAQLEASGKNAILIVPELAYDRTSGDPGALAEPGAFAALIDETLGKLAPQIGDGVTSSDLGRVVVASHSAGYQTAAAAARAGGVAIDELYLLDSLYGQFDDYDAWVMDAKDAIAATPFAKRFASVYTLGGGTIDNSHAMATRAAGWFAAWAIEDDRTTSTWGATQYAHGMLFKRTGLSHDGVPRYYFGRLIATSGL